ncbi:hypothetical protein JQX13_37025 [Archangium violaceum]|uniref:hypothetical protein n=1 Tax=Archangium violaceum TaxID=83451 RepID=UPI00193C67D6|nr:hypothetical protein [Archangium violaceum]QRK05711.1 hypothetical protein JQX13_37025 [Archangium violaceum]
MIRSVLLIACLALPRTTWAAEEPAADSTQPARGDDAQAADSESKKEDTTIERHRTPFEALNERMIGTASRAVRFDWRQTRAGIGLVGSQLLELNNFKSTRLGGFVRTPIGGFLGEIAITRVFTRGSSSTEKLALTPYRQSGRPSRFELDLNLGYPLAEGVATARPGFFPATELVFSANAGLRYLFYPGSLSGASFGETVTSLFAPKLSEREVENLESSRLPGMQLDGARYSLLTGFSLDIYFQPGGFLSPRVLVALPLISGVDGSGLGLWWELSFSAGWAF